MAHILISGCYTIEREPDQPDEDVRADQSTFYFEVRVTDPPQIVLTTGGTDVSSDPQFSFQPLLVLVKTVYPDLFKEEAQT